MEPGHIELLPIVVLAQPARRMEAGPIGFRLSREHVPAQQLGTARQTSVKVACETEYVVAV
jgi:hypothetical protein